jgi:glycosyltransferase involved in cell wall biosynthesis
MKAPEIPDVIIATSVPLSVLNTAARLGETFGAKTIIDVQDLWPEMIEYIFPRRLRFFAKMFMLPLKLWAHRVYQEVDAITSISETGLRMVTSTSKKVFKEIMVLPLGTDLELYRACADEQAGDMPYIKHNKNEFWATYIGTIGKSYDVNTILRAAARLAHSHANIKFILAGTGPDYDRMGNLAQRKRLTNVTFTGLLDYKRLVHVLEQSDIGLNAFAPDAENPLPNKLFDYLAAGLPIVNSLVGEVQDLMEKEQVGTQYEAGNAESLAKAIVELYDNPQERLAMKQRARRLAEERFDMNKEYPKFEAFLQAVVASPSRNKRD